MKNKKDMIKWLNNLKNDIGQPQHCQLWHYAEILDVVVKYLEVSEPVHGEWILADEQRKEDTDNDNYRYICSECGHSDLHSKSQEVPYCWWCGAKMLTKESTENLNLKADGEGVSKGGVSNGDTERHDSCSR